MTIIPYPEMLKQAQAEIAKGNYDEADQLAGEVLTRAEPESVSRVEALLTLANTARMRGDFDRSLEFGIQALALSEKYNYPNRTAGALNVIGIIYRNLGLYDKALEHYTRAVEISRNLGDQHMTARLTGNIGMVYNRLGSHQKALEYYTQALVMYHEFGDKSAIASITVNIGVVYDYLGDYDKALEFYATALGIYTELGEQSGIASITGNIGIIHKMTGTYDKALEYFTQALDLHELLGEKSAAARVKQNLGLLYAELGSLERALEYYNQALETQEALGAKSETAQILGNIGIVYLQPGSYHTALEYFARSLALHEEIGDRTEAAQVMGNIGNAYISLGDYDKALEYYGLALSIHRELGEEAGIALVTGNIGSALATVAYAGYNATVAEELLLEALTMNESLGIKWYQHQNHLNLATVYELQGDTAKALYHYKQYHAIEKEVQSEEHKKQAQRGAFERQIGAMQREQEVTERILHSILPKDIAHRIRRGDKKIIDKYDSVSVLFADIVGFTKLSHAITPEQLVEGLDVMFNTFDRLADKHGCEKIKTIGDCYMVVAGLPERCEDHVLRLTAMALDMQHAIENFPDILAGGSIRIRIGMHTGSVVAGIIGKNKFSYDLWGDAVNTASRMESHGEPGKIHVTEEFLKKLLMVKGEWLMDEVDDVAPLTINHLPFTINHLPFTIIPRGELDIKGKGLMNTYFLEKLP